MNKIWTIAFAGLILAALQGCEDDAEIGDNGRTISYSVMHSGQQRVEDIGSSKKSYVISTDEEYQAVLADYTIDSPDEIDFDEERVLLVDLGERADNSFSIGIDEMVEYDDYVIADVEVKQKNENCGISEVVSYPFVFFNVPTDKDILIREDYVSVSCDSNTTS